MRKVAVVVGFGVLAILSGAAAPGAAADGPSAQSKSCSDRAAEQGLQGQAKDTFNATCLKGSLAPKQPTTQVHNTAAANALVKPSGADRTVRSSQCNAEATKRGLKDSGLQAFRKGCLASAAPVGAIETSERPTTPTRAKPKLDALTDAPAH